jgi:hypothetical protein
MEYLVDAVPYERAGWRTASRATRVSTGHALYRQYDELICFGVDQAGPVREIDNRVVDPFLSVIEAQMLGEGFPGDHGLSPRRVSGFDLLGHVSGDERQLMRGWAKGPGWSNDIRVVHVFPCFACELSAAWSTQRFASVMREVKVLDIARKPIPYIEIKMRGGKSRLLIKKWSHETLTSTLIFARILAEEPEGVLEVRNLAGDVIVFSSGDGWHAFEERITAHALRSSNTQ